MTIERAEDLVSNAPSLLVFSFVAACIALPAAESFARAETYVDAPAFGRPVVGIGIYGGVPVATQGAASDRAPTTFGGGSELLYGYAWDSGWSLYGTFGAARWSARGPLGQLIGDRDAGILEASAGLAARYTLGAGSLAPFVQSSLLGELLRVRGGVASGDASGAGVGVLVGVRIRTAPWEAWLGLDVRRAHFSSLDADGAAIDLARIALVIGGTVETR